MKFSRDRCLLGSCSHDNTVKFWNVRYLFEDDEDEDNGVDVDPSSDNKTGTIMDAEMADREADTATQDESRTTKTVTSPQRQGLPSAPSAAVQSIQQQIRKQRIAKHVVRHFFAMRGSLESRTSITVIIR